MSTSKVKNTDLAVELAQDSNYRIFKNGSIKKRGADGKFRTIGSTRHGYNVITYKGKTLVTARVLAAKRYLDIGYDSYSAFSLLQNRVVNRKNGTSLDDRLTNLKVTRPSLIKRDETKRLSRKQIDKMVALFCEGLSVAKIARRFRRRISRSHISRTIRRELGITA